MSVAQRAGGVTARAELARVALEAAVKARGVAAGNAGPDGRYVTAYGDATLAGVVAAAEGEGRFSVDLFLTAELVPLIALGERLPGLVHKAAGAQDLGERLGSVSVTFLDVEHPLGWPS